MKFNRPQPGLSKKQTPKSWEVWLADAPFGPAKKIRRCPVVVGKRSTDGFRVYEIVPKEEAGSAGVTIADTLAAGQDRPCAVSTIGATVQIQAFIQMMGHISEPEAAKILSKTKK